MPTPLITKLEDFSLLVSTHTFPLEKAQTERFMKRFAVLLSLLIFTYGLAFTAHGDYSRDVIWCVVSALTFLVMIGYLWLRSRVGQIAPCIVVSGSYISLPSWCFWARKIPVSDVFSVEEFKGFDGTGVVVLGLMSGETLWIDSAKFANDESYREFKIAIETILQKDTSSDRTLSLSIVKRTRMHLFVQLIFVSLWAVLLTYFSLLSDANYERAMMLGVLSKNVLGGEELYRLSSWFFLHAGAAHLLLNCLVFACVSESLLRIVDVSRYLLLLYVSIFFAALSTLYVSDHTYVVGASGGVFGLFGAYCAVKLNRRLPGTVSRGSDTMVYITIAMEVVGEYFAEGIDSYVHLGGFIAGFLFMKLYLALKAGNSIFHSSVQEKAGAILCSLAFLAGLLRFLWLATHA